jgi:rhamnogalacturonan endolyase
MRRSVILLAVAALVVGSCAPLGGDAVLFQDDLAGVRRGPLSAAVGAHTEYHYLPEAAPRCAWSVSNDLGWWSLRQAEGKRWLCQSGSNDLAYAYPILVAGDALWQDYRVRALLKPESADRRCGILFRYQNDRRHYFFGVEAGRAVLKVVDHGEAFHQLSQKTLAEADFSWQPGDVLSAEIVVKGPEIRAGLNGKVWLEAVDATYPSGKIGLTADGPAAFTDVKVTASPADRRKFAAARQVCDDTERRLQSGNPRPVVWKKIRTEGFGVGRNVRFGDLDHDGTVDVLIGQVVHHGPTDRNSELSCLTAMTLDGTRLWQLGAPDAWKTHLTNDVAFQIHDLDRDGRNEVIYCMNRALIVAEGATGRTRFKVPTPAMPGGERILGDCLYFCDLRGLGHDSDIIIKDRYHHIWAYDDKLQPRWHAACNTGHYPYACDVDGDGRDELMVGYTLFDDDGKVLWSLDDRLSDHADGVALLRLRPDADLRLVCAASDEGIFLTDMQGRILLHRQLGHVQSPALANFRDDLPGLEIVTVNFWRNQGIIHYFDADGRVYHSFEPTQYGSLCLPINWTGRSEEFFVLNANVDEGGLFDGWGRRVVTFPDDGHPDMCDAVLDLTGDCRDEIVVWDPHQMWVYTQSDNPRPGRLYKPTRNPLYNTSNYQATVSLPGWSGG